MTGVITREKYAGMLLSALGIRITKRKLLALVSWMQAEGSQASFNPLATTQAWPGATNFNSVGVKNYATLEDGILATAQTLNYGADRGLYGYRKIRSRLKHNSRPARTLRAVEKSAWGTGGLALQVLPYARKDWERYRSVPVAN